jgi:hypothetical protein
LGVSEVAGGEELVDGEELERFGADFGLGECGCGGEGGLGEGTEAGLTEGEAREEGEHEQSD